MNKQNLNLHTRIELDKELKAHLNSSLGLSFQNWSNVGLKQHLRSDISCSLFDKTFMPRASVDFNGPSGGRQLSISTSSRLHKSFGLKTNISVVEKPGIEIKMKAHLEAKYSHNIDKFRLSCSARVLCFYLKGRVVIEYFQADAASKPSSLRSALPHLIS